MPMTPPGENEVQPTAPGRGQRLLIAIDGPAAAGKTTVARELADRAGAIFLDTGLLYRAITLAALRRGVSLTDAEGLTDLVRRLDLAIRPASVNDGRPLDLLLNGEDVTPLLRTPEIDAAVSAVSATPGVRAELLPVQRALANRGRVVMVGRDIATVVAPDAELKIYLDASPEERARRRHAELATRGVDLPYELVLEDLERRDIADSSRATAPLAKAHDAIVVDTDGRTVEEIVSELLDLTEATAASLSHGGRD